MTVRRAGAIVSVALTSGCSARAAARTGGAERFDVGLTGSRRRELFACLGAANGSSSSLVRCIARGAG
jgi:hypothetical protein